MLLNDLQCILVLIKVAWPSLRHPCEEVLDATFTIFGFNSREQKKAVKVLVHLR